MIKKSILLLWIFCFNNILFSQQRTIEQFTQITNRLIKAMNANDYVAITNEYDKNMLIAFPLFKTKIYFGNLFVQYGNALRIDTPVIKSTDQASIRIYFEKGVQDLTLYLDDQLKIKGLLFSTPTDQTTTSATSKPQEQKNIESEKPSKPIENKEQATASSTTTINTEIAKPKEQIVEKPVVPDKQKTEIYLPFNGTWIVTKGGEKQTGAAAMNLLTQQFAYEFAATDANGMTYKTDGKTNEDYFAYGKDIVSPADGIIVEVIDGIRENSPGIRNPYAPIGNAVIIQHPNSEYSVIAFLKTGSIKVKVGNTVKRGQVIAQCGISGNAIEPSVHYHLQDSPYLQNAKGKKFYFEKAFISKGDKKEQRLIHLPQAGEIVSQD